VLAAAGDPRLLGGLPGLLAAAITLDGLRPRPDSTLPPTALSYEQLQALAPHLHR
jgi:hypothetical protein